MQSSLSDLYKNEELNKPLTQEQFDDMFDLTKDESIAYYNYVKDKSEIFSDPII